MAGPRDDARRRGLPASSGGTGYTTPRTPDNTNRDGGQTGQSQPRISRYNLRGNAVVQNIDMTEMRSYLDELSLSNYYQVNLNTLTKELDNHLAQPGYNLDRSWFSQKIGLLCTEANLPGSSFATSEVKDNYMGVSQEFAHTRLYTDLDLTFYVDKNYNTLRFFEGWMDYISGGNYFRDVDPNNTLPNAPNNTTVTNVSKNFYRRMNYPETYKIDNLFINKFERDTYKQKANPLGEFRYVMTYQFINAFPKSLSPVTISYGPADVLKVTVTFNYDRFLVSRWEKDLYSASKSTSNLELWSKSSPEEQRVIADRFKTEEEFNQWLRK